MAKYASTTNNKSICGCPVLQALYAKKKRKKEKDKTKTKQAKKTPPKTQATSPPQTSNKLFSTWILKSYSCQFMNPTHSSTSGNSKVAI